MLGVPKWYTGICAPSQPQPAGQTTSTEALAAEQSFPKGQTWFAHSCALCNHSVKKPGKTLTETPALPAHVAGAYEAVAWSSSPTAAQLSDFHKQDVTWCANGHAFHWSCALDQLTGDATQACPVCDLPPTPELHAEFSKMADNSRRMSRVDVIRQTLLSRGKYEEADALDVGGPPPSPRGEGGNPYDGGAMYRQLMDLVPMAPPPTRQSSKRWQEEKYSLYARGSLFENLNYDEYRKLWEEFGEPRRPPKPPPAGYDGIYGMDKPMPVQPRTPVPSTPPPRARPTPTPTPAAPPSADVPITGQEMFSLPQWMKLGVTMVTPGRARSPKYPGKILVYTERDGMVVVDFEDDN